jgi:glutaconate CoA-transferase subunit B
VRDETGFEFDLPAKVGETPAPDADTLRLMRERVAPELAEVYPEFTAKIFNIRH